jgi:hypothetical protein
MFDSEFAIFNIHVHDATLYIAIISLVMEFGYLAFKVLRDCKKLGFCRFSCSYFLSLIAILGPVLLLYVLSDNKE